MRRNEVTHRRTSERISRLPKHCVIAPKSSAFAPAYPAHRHARAYAPVAISMRKSTFAQEPKGASC